MSETTHPHAAGCIVYRDDAAPPRMLLIRDQYGRWTVPKGHLEDGEDAVAAALRETQEETGVVGELGASLGEIRYTVTTRKGRLYEKRVAFFLLRATSYELTLQAEEGIDAASWLTLDEALALDGYDQVDDVLRLAWAALT